MGYCARSEGLYNRLCLAGVYEGERRYASRGLAQGTTWELLNLEALSRMLPCCSGMCR